MTGSPAYDIGYVIGALLPIAVVVGIIVVVVGLVMRSRRGGNPSLAGRTDIRMSEDGRYWWDGTNWQDATNTVPPHAQRSPDGAYWWDGKSWRPVPR